MKLFSNIGKIGILLFSLVGFKCSSPENEVHIRVRNLTGQPIEKFWMGAGKKYSTYMGSIASGAESTYSSFELIKANYNKYNFLITNAKHQYIGVNKPEDYLGKQDLEANHYYTFEITLANDTPQTHIILDK